MSRLLSVLRGHLHFLVLVTALIVVMTYPTIFYVFDFETFWLPTQVQDVWTNIWNIWYGKLLVNGQAEFLYTDLMFYPDGVSLAYHSFSIPHMLVAGVLETFMPVANAYNLTYLLTIFSAALSAYVYLLYLLRHKWIALFGAVIFGCSSYVIGRPSQPDMAIIATIPLSLYFFHRAVLEKRWSLAALSGFLTGATAFIGIYTYVCLLIALGLFIFYFALLRWRHPGFWGRVIALLVIAGSIGMLRVYPMLRDADSLEYALAKHRGEEFNNDLMQYFVNLDHPFTTPFFREFFGLEIYPRHNTSYLGYIPLALVIFGFMRSAYRRKMLFWLYLMVPFLVLRLGTALTINGQRYEAVVLPKEILDNLVPSIFTAIYSPDYFYCGALIPLAVLSCYGLLTLLRSMSKRLRFFFIVLAILATACEYYVARDDFFLTDQQLAFLDWLEQEDDQDSIRLIHVPMGRVNANLFDFYQTLSAYPHAEGGAGRPSPAAYSYINSNLLLETWIASESIQCQHSNESQYLAAIDALAQDGFSHVVMHRKLWNSPYVADSFLYAHASYQDDFSAIYRLSDLRRSCPEEMPGYEVAAHLNEFFALASPVPKRNESIMSLHPNRPLGAELFRFYSAEAAGWQSLIHVSQDAEGQALVQSSDDRSANLVDIEKRNSIVWLVYNPQETDPQRIAVYNDWFVQQYRECRRVHNSFHIRVELFIRRDFPCELIDAEAALSVLYDNGIQLANRLYSVSENELRVFLWWSEPRGGDHAYSIQIFDANGVKVAWDTEHLIRNDPLAFRRIDISQLRPGVYSARLIVYHVDSKKSQPGTILQNQHSFRRELEIAHFSIQA